MWPGGTLHVVVGTLKISLDQLKKKKGTKRSYVECCSVSCCEQCVMLACESKLASRSSTKATVAKTVFVE